MSLGEHQHLYSQHSFLDIKRRILANTVHPRILEPPKIFLLAVFSEYATFN